MKQEYKMCSRCVMDNISDDNITFNNTGFCNYCSEALSFKNRVYFPNEEGQKRLQILVSRIKEENKHNDYDCLMGISGGLDSSYLAYLGYTWGLRIKAIHVDDGFDTDISKTNIQSLCNAANIELIVVMPDETQYASLIRAYMRAGIANLATPQDNILFAELYNQLRKEKTKYFLAGTNFAFESIGKTSNHTVYDIKNINDINKRFGDGSIDKLHFISTQRKILDSKFFGYKTVNPLNYVDYNQERAFRELNDFCDYKYYGSKHLENALTAFIQLCWYPQKFNIDKRKWHFSSMIISEQMCRDEAIEKLNELPVTQDMLDGIIDEVLKKIGMSKEEFKNIMCQPTHEFDEYQFSKFHIHYNQTMKFLSNIKHNKIRER